MAIKDVLTNFFTATIATFTVNQQVYGGGGVQCIMLGPHSGLQIPALFIYLYACLDTFFSELRAAVWGDSAFHFPQTGSKFHNGFQIPRCRIGLQSRATGAPVCWPFTAGFHWSLWLRGQLQVFNCECGHGAPKLVLCDGHAFCRCHFTVFCVTRLLPSPCCICHHNFIFPNKINVSHHQQW